MSSPDCGKRAPKSTKHAKTPLFPPCSQLAYSRRDVRLNYTFEARISTVARFLDKLGDQRRAPEWTFNRSASVSRMNLLHSLLPCSSLEFLTSFHGLREGRSSLSLKLLWLSEDWEGSVGTAPPWRAT